MTLLQLSPHLYRFADTCNVYALRHEDSAVLIDYGSGAIEPLLAQMGVQRVTHILMTHHHRDQGQGLPHRTNAAEVWAPHTEQDLFHSVEAHWQARPVMNDYNMRQDRFSLLHNVPLAGALQDYASYQFGGFEMTVWPTPGHTTGSVTLLVTVDGRRVAFSGDLITAPGQLWTLAATQWSYNGAEGAPATILSLLSLKELGLDLLLPSHGEPMHGVAEAIDLLAARLWALLRERRQNPRLFELRERPYQALTPHLLWNRTSMAYSYVLRSESGKALFFDLGYDFFVGGAAGSDRASRRPWLYTLGALKAQHGIDQVEAVVPTHFHDDHVAGANLLRDVEGAAVWAPQNFAAILEEPRRYDLPCLWYDAIAVDRVLPLSRPISWEEYTFTLYPLPGHTRYAVAIALDVDGKRVLISGDQYQGEDGLLWNYVYHNGFEAHDYVASAALYRRLAPDLILSGHWQPLWLAGEEREAYLAQIEQSGEALARAHRELLPAQALGAGAEGFVARLQPYQLQASAGTPFDLVVEVRNPLDQRVTAEVSLATPRQWQARPVSQSIELDAGQLGYLTFWVTAPQPEVQRRPVAADVTINGRRWGQQGEALVTVD